MRGLTKIKEDLELANGHEPERARDVDIRTTAEHAWLPLESAVLEGKVSRSKARALALRVVMLCSGRAFDGRLTAEQRSDWLVELEYAVWRLRALEIQMLETTGRPGTGIDLNQLAFRGWA